MVHLVRRCERAVWAWGGSWRFTGGGQRGVRANMLTRDGQRAGGERRGVLEGSREGTRLGCREGCWKDAREDAKTAGEMPAGCVVLEREVWARRILSRISFDMCSILLAAPLLSCPSCLKRIKCECASGAGFSSV